MKTTSSISPVASIFLLFQLVSLISIAVCASLFWPDAASHLRGGGTAVSATVEQQQHRFLQEIANNNETCTPSCCLQHNETICIPIVCPVCAAEEEDSPFSKLPYAVQIILMLLLLFMSAMFSGLTLGLMGLDKTGLEIVMDSDDAVNARYASKIYPLRKNGNLLLCTLLLGNTAVNALLSILMASFTNGLLGFFISTFAILIFGEIIPQAVCSRYALQIGSRAVPIVRIIMVILYPLCKPLSMALDVCLGKELATTYSSAEMLKLLQIHVDEEVMDPDTANTMTGALKYKDVAVQDVMTPLENTFMLKTDEKLNFETIAKIFKTGYSRIPVYEVSKDNVIGLLFVKDLIFVDPEDETRVSDFVDIFGRGVHVVWHDDKLDAVLRELKQGRSHMALVRGVNNEDESQDPFYEILGIITLEDIIEEILGDEIVDETDTFLDGTHSVRLDRADAFKFARLRLLDSKIVDETLSLEETKAVTAHLWKNFPQVVSLLTENQLHRLIAETPVSNLPTAPQDVGERLPSDLMYEKGVQSDVCTLILAGKVTVLVGIDEFRSDVSSWSLLGAGAVEDPEYTPDFTAFVAAGPCRCLRIIRARFSAAVDASASERTQLQHASSHASVGSQRDDASASEKDDASTSAGTEPVDLDKSEKSRKSKFMTALRAVEKDSKLKESPASTPPRQSSVSFSESGSSAVGVGSNSSRLSSRNKKSSRVPSTPETTSTNSHSPFAFISGSPAATKGDDLDDGDSNTK